MEGDCGDEVPCVGSVEDSCAADSDEELLWVTVTGSKEGVPCVASAEGDRATGSGEWCGKMSLTALLGGGPVADEPTAGVACAVAGAAVSMVAVSGLSLLKAE